MFEISVLKEMKLAELQKIAKLAKNIKSTGVKKDDLIQLILEAQAATPAEKVAEKVTPKIVDDKQKRARIAPEKKPVIQKKKEETLFSETVEAPLEEKVVAEKVKLQENVPNDNQPKIVKGFKKAD